MLESLGEKSTKANEALIDPRVEEQLQQWEDDVRSDIADYLVVVLQPIMIQGAKPSITKYKLFLPEWFKLRFDLPTEPAAQYLAKLKRLHLSDYKGSISATTNNEVRALIERGLLDGKSYSEIAANIHKMDPLVFSKARANMIATTEIGRAYGFADYQVALKMQSLGHTMMKKWITAHDEKVRPTHTKNEALGWIPLSERYPNGDMFAASEVDIRCRCHSQTKSV